tara:strand:- start:45 stop:617 length:573 start_codon:yes stop_codon:yes gene_type:complete
MEYKYPYYPIFVYGRLQSGFSNHRRIFENSLNVLYPGEFRKGVLCHYIDNDKIGACDMDYGFCDIENTKYENDIIKGEILYLYKENYYETIQEIDKFVGYYGVNNDNNIYKRCIRSVYYKDGKGGKEIKALIYLGTRLLQYDTSVRRLVLKNCNSWKDYVSKTIDISNFPIHNNCRINALYPMQELEEAL